MGSDLFPGFATHRLAGDGVDIHARIGGRGPLLIFLHGYPQTHVCWHRIAPALASRFTVVAMDLRGYGASDAPPGEAGHVTYAKRTMARDVAAVMRGLGHDRCSLVGHDRGARVAYRMALDMPECVDRVVLIDILPTAEVWSGLRAASAVASYHWSFLAQPAPIPETLIGGAPDLYAEHTLKSWTQAKSLACFDPVALEHYRALLRDPRRVHAICEDYRAGWTVDRALDEADQAAGRRIAAPALVLWGSDYVGKGAASPLEVWRRWAVDVTGEEIMSGHFLAEESADQTLAAVLGFLGRG